MSENLVPMIHCPRWRRCSVPICPLDPHKDERTGPVGDEARCTLAKIRRMKLGASLPWRGLWPRELAGLRMWERKSEAERLGQALQGKRNLGLL